MQKERSRFLKKLKEKGLSQNIPNISEKNAQCLSFFVRLKKASSVLEIGTANGYSTIWLADAIEHQNHPRYLGIDISEPSYTQAVKNIKAQKLDAFVELKSGNALEILSKQKEKFDIVFLDAQKALYVDFWEVIKPLLHDDSLVMVDDVLKFPQKTKHFLEKIKKESGYENIIIPIDGDDGIMLIQKKKQFF